MSQVSHIDAQLGALQADLTRIAGAVVQARAPLGAIRRLPPEILSRIFAETIIFPTRMTPNFDENHLADIQPNKSWHIHERESPLWSIELVCKQWRREVLASHALMDAYQHRHPYQELPRGKPPLPAAYRHSAHA